MSGFGYSSNSRLGQKRPKRNLIESSARSSTKDFQIKTLLKIKLYLSGSGIRSKTLQVRFSCNSDSGPYNEFLSKALVKCLDRGLIKTFPKLLISNSWNLWFDHWVLNLNFSRTQFFPGPYKAFPRETLVKVPAGSLRRSQSNFFHITFWLHFPMLHFGYSSD